MRGWDIEKDEKMDLKKDNMRDMKKGKKKGLPMEKEMAQLNDNKRELEKTCVPDWVQTTLNQKMKDLWFDSEMKKGMYLSLDPQNFPIR